MNRLGNCALLVVLSMRRDKEGRLPGWVAERVLLCSLSGLFCFLVVLRAEFPTAVMSHDDLEGEPPFTPEQLAWIDKMVEARQASLATGTGAGVPDASPPTSGTTSLTTAVSQPGRCRRVRGKYEVWY